MQPVRPALRPHRPGRDGQLGGRHVVERGGLVGGGVQRLFRRSGRLPGQALQRAERRPAGDRPSAEHHRQRGVQAPGAHLHRGIPPDQRRLGRGQLSPHFHQRHLRPLGLRGGLRPCRRPGRPVGERLLRPGPGPGLGKRHLRPHPPAGRHPLDRQQPAESGRVNYIKSCAFTITIKAQLFYNILFNCDIVSSK